MKKLSVNMTPIQAQALILAEFRYYSEFSDASNDAHYSDAERTHEVLLSIQDEIDGGWIFSIKELITADYSFSENHVAILIGTHLLTADDN